MIGFPYVGNAVGVAQLQESCTLVNVGNQPHCDNGEGVGHHPLTLSLVLGK
jgi:hypothetical protein